MLIITWNYSNNRTSAIVDADRLTPNDWIWDFINSQQGSKEPIYMDPNAECTCAVRSISNSLRAYLVRYDRMPVKNKNGFLVNIPGVRVELESKEVFIAELEPEEETDLLMRFVC